MRSSFVIMFTVRYRYQRVAPVDTSLLAQLKEALANLEHVRAENRALVQELEMYKQQAPRIAFAHDTMNRLKLEQEMRALDNECLKMAIEANKQMKKDLNMLQKKLLVVASQRDPPGILQQIKECLKCPITQDYLQDPVIASDGMLYERGSIDKWMQRKPMSPLTNQILENKTLISCFVARQILGVIDTAGI